MDSIVCPRCSKDIIKFLHTSFCFIHNIYINNIPIDIYVLYVFCYIKGLLYTCVTLAVNNKRWFCLDVNT